MPIPEFKNSFLSIDTPLDADKKKFFLRSVSAAERMSQLFELQLELISTDASVNFDQIIGKNVNVGIQLADGSDRIFNGFVSRFTQSTGSKLGAHYHATVVPWLWFLTRTTDCYIFQDKKVPDIVQAVAKKFGFDKYMEIRVDSSKYRTWDYCVQYRETAAHFIMRLLEQEGIFFFFTHEKGSHTMVLGDVPSHNKPCNPESKFRYAPETRSSGEQFQDDVIAWQMEQEIRTGKRTLRDYNFESPRSNLQASTPSKINQGGNTKFEMYEYPGEYDSLEEGTDYTKRQMEEEEVPHAVIHGVSHCRPFSAGFRFSVSGSERKDQDGTYLLTAVSHMASEGAGLSDPGGSGSDYSNSFVCIPIAVPYRPPRTTTRALMKGSQTAVVVGPSGEEIYTDKYGRVKVQFFWDREGKKDEKSSCWVRVSHAWAGTNWGAIYIPRIGHEVIVDFLEGDPDQPIITGRVYNADNMPPYELPANMTQSGFKTRSSKGGGSQNFNEIRFEDKKGSELLYVHAELNKTESVEQDSREYVGNDRLRTIGNDRKTLIKADDHFHVQGVQRQYVEHGRSTHIGDKWVVKVDGPYSVDVQSMALHAGSISINVDQSISLNGPGGFVKIDASGVTISGTMVLINSGGAPEVQMPDTVNDPRDPDETDGGSKGT